MQYGDFQSDELLGAARYRLSWSDPTEQRSVFSFLYVPRRLCPQFRNRKRCSRHKWHEQLRPQLPWSNGALVVQVEQSKDFPSTNPLQGFNFQREIEKKAFDLSQAKASGKELPAMYVQEFLKGKNE